MNNRENKSSDRRVDKSKKVIKNRRKTIGRRYTERFSMHAYYAMIVTLSVILIFFTNFIIFNNFN